MNLVLKKILLFKDYMKLLDKTIYKEYMYVHMCVQNIYPNIYAYMACKYTQNYACT